MPPTYVATTDDAQVSVMNSLQELDERTTKSANFPGNRDPKSPSIKLANAAEIVYLQ